MAYSGAASVKAPRLFPGLLNRDAGMNRRFASAVFSVSLAFGIAWMATPASAQRGATRARVQMPQGPVREIIRKNCTMCHGIDDYGYFAFDRAGWQTLIETKHKATP